jgi:L-lactate utilization protein LutC
MPTPVEDANKGAFIERVRAALGRTEPIAHTPDHVSLKTTMLRQEEKVRTIQAKAAARRSQSIAMLVENATAASWNVHRPSSGAAAAVTVAEIAQSVRAKHVIRSAEDIFKRVDVDATLRGAGITSTVLASGRSRRRSELQRLAFESDMGVTGVGYAIAETASCVVTPRRGVARLTSLAPPVIALIVEEDQVLETLDDFFAITRLELQHARGRTPNYFNFISGPSRTADIEQTLTIGVHGPGEVHMIIVG